jgi:hypothetical protein
MTFASGCAGSGPHNTGLCHAWVEPKYYALGHANGHGLHGYLYPHSPPDQRRQQSLSDGPASPPPHFRTPPHTPTHIYRCPCSPRHDGSTRSMLFCPGPSTARPDGQQARAGMARWSKPFLGRIPGTWAGTARPVFYAGLMEAHSHSPNPILFSRNLFQNAIPSRRSPFPTRVARASLLSSSPHSFSYPRAASSLSLASQERTGTPRAPLLCDSPGVCHHGLLSSTRQRLERERGVPELCPATALSLAR